MYNRYHALAKQITVVVPLAQRVTRTHTLRCYTTKKKSVIINANNLASSIKNNKGLKVPYTIEA